MTEHVVEPVKPEWTGMGPLGTSPKDADSIFEELAAERKAKSKLAPASLPAKY